MNIENPELVKIYGFWSAVMVLKLLLMVPLTAKQRFTKGIFANPEDLKLPKGKVVYNDPDVERVRRAHLNDLENIVPWFVITYVWLTTNPSVWLANVLIKSFALSRILHTFVYAVFPQQPLRFIAFFVGYFIMIYEAISIVSHYV